GSLGADDVGGSALGGGLYIGTGLFSLSIRGFVTEEQGFRRNPTARGGGGAGFTPAPVRSPCRSAGSSRRTRPSAATPQKCGPTGRSSAWPAAAPTSGPATSPSTARRS